MNLFDFYIPEQILVAISLIVLVFVLKRILWKPLMKVIDSRQADVDGLLQRAEEARKLIADMEEQRASHDAELERLTFEKIKEARELAGREYDRIVAKAEEKARMYAEAGEEKARRAYEQSMDNSREAIINLALGAASTVIETSMTTEINQKLIEAMLRKAGAGHG